MISDALEAGGGGSPLLRAVRWYRLSLLVLAAGILLQALLGWIFIEAAILVPALAVAAPCLALRGMMLFRSETGRLGNEAPDIETRRKMRALRWNSGPVLLIAVVSALLVLVSLMNIQAMVQAMEAARSIISADAPQPAGSSLSALAVVRTLSLLIGAGIVAGLAVAFFRVRKFAQAAAGIATAPARR